MLDMSGPAAAEVRKIRQRHGYDFLGALPVEVTVAGSSGIGSPVPNQEPKDIFAALDRVAAETPVITGRFGPVIRFPDSDIFVLTMEDPDPFIELHQRIVNSGIRYLPSPFPFTPHCTLRQRQSPTQEEVDDVMGMSISSEFRCDMLSTYVLEGFPLLKRRHRSYLTG